MRFGKRSGRQNAPKKKSSFSPSTVPQVLIEKRGQARWKRENEDGNQPMIEQTLRLIARITSSVQASFMLCFPRVKSLKCRLKKRLVLPMFKNLKI